MKTQKDMVKIGFRATATSEDGPASAVRTLVKKRLPILVKLFTAIMHLVALVWYFPKGSKGQSTLDGLIGTQDSLRLDDLDELTKLVSHGASKEDFRGRKTKKYANVTVTTDEYGVSSAELLIAISIKQQVLSYLGGFLTFNCLTDGDIIDVGADFDYEGVSLQLEGVDPNSTASEAGRAYARANEKVAEKARKVQEDLHRQSMKAAKKAEIARLMAMTGKTAEECVELLKEAGQAVDEDEEAAA